MQLEGKESYRYSIYVFTDYNMILNTEEVTVLPKKEGESDTIW